MSTQPHLSPRLILVRDDNGAPRLVAVWEVEDDHLALRWHAVPAGPVAQPDRSEHWLPV